MLLNRVGLHQALGVQGVGFQCLSLSLFLSVNSALAVESSDYPRADAALGERLHASETQHARNIANSIEASLRLRYPNGAILRDAHPKMHGCLQAEFRVASNVPKHLQQGVLTPGKSYPAVVRFSNGNSDATRSDVKGDTRGMAIKLSGVSGGTLSGKSEQQGKQDFLLISFPAFFVNEAADYDEFFEIMNSGSVWRMWKLPFLLGIRGSINAFKMLSTVPDNPLTARYWSAVPYQLGVGESRFAVKYSAKSCKSQMVNEEARRVNENDPDYLRAALVRSVSSHTACMEFMLQAAPAKASIENVVNEWSESDSEFIPVAQLHFPAQSFDSEAQLLQCERMVFNPWHAIEAHKPLGAVNRMRKLVYDRISSLRAERQ